jgi:hypothetical protein
MARLEAALEALLDLVAVHLRVVLAALGLRGGDRHVGVVLLLVHRGS